MAKLTLNDKSVRRDPPATGQIELWDKTFPGFGIRIAAGGSRTYFVMKRLNGKLARRTVGVHPPLSVMHDAKLREGEFWPAGARKRAREMAEDMARGIDPKPAKASAAAAAAVDDLSFKGVADKYLADKLQGGGADLKSKAELERKLKADLKEWHSRPIAEIRGRDIRELIRTKAQESPIAANRLLSFIKRVFRWAASQDYIDADPAAAIDKPGKESTRDRYLGEDEIRLFWRAADKIGDPAGRLFKLALLTAQRRGEVAGLRRSELGKLEYRTQDKTTGKEVLTTGRAWLLPAERTKRGVAHTVPLSPLAAKLIDGAPKLKVGKTDMDHVFASGARGDQPITGWSRFKARLDDQIGRLMAEDAGQEYDPKTHALAPWHIHDLRATAATFMEMDRLGIPRAVISRILNHSEGDGRSMTARYTRHKWDKEAADALDAWADELGRIVGMNVVGMKDGRA
jgi:integrase